MSAVGGARKPSELASGWGKAAGVEGRAWGGSARCLGVWMEAGGGGEGATEGSQPGPGPGRTGALVCSSLLEKGQSLFAPSSLTDTIVITMVTVAHTH